MNKVDYRFQLCFWIFLEIAVAVHAEADFCRSKSDDCGARDDSAQILTQNASQFTAAVVEFYPEQDRNLLPEIRLARNVQHYITILTGIQQKIDVIVYPEATLSANAPVQSRDDLLPYTVEIPDEFDGPSLCTGIGSTSYLAQLACAAISFDTYIVVNLVERAACKHPKCSPNGWDFYNTNVVFNRKGAVVARYRKYNLFGEYLLNQTATPDVSIFETDFGVKFGLFTCFDILFRKPTLELIRQHQLTHIIYPTMWFSELPFLTALQAQQQWAYGVDAVFLAAGANDPKVGSGGTGIFQGKSGPIVYDILGNFESRAYVATIPQQTSSQIPHDVNTTDTLAKSLDNFYLKRDDLKPYTSKLVTPKQAQVADTVCSGNGGDRICCSFDISMEWDDKILSDNKNHYQYHMVAYSGVRSFSGVYNGGVEICGVVACTGATLDLCSQRFANYDTVSWPATFTKLVIKANFKVDDNRVQFPNSLLSSMRPLPVDAIEWTQNLGKATVGRTYTLTKPQNRLMTFAIYGRDFNRDNDPANPGGIKSGAAGLVYFRATCCLLFVLLKTLIQM